MKKPIFSHLRADEVGVAIHSINLESTFSKVDSSIAPILNEPAKDSRISKNFVLWITKEAAAHLALPRHCWRSVSQVREKGIAPILNEPAKDSRISKNFVLWITKEAAAHLALPRHCWRSVSQVREKGRCLKSGF